MKWLVTEGLDVLELPAEDDVDPVVQRSVLLWDGKPRLPAHDYHILLSYRTVRAGQQCTAASAISV